MGILVGAFQLVTFVVNFDQIQAIKNVEVVLDSPGLMNGIATVNVKVTNLNPVVISDMALRYTITGPNGASASSGTVNIPDHVPSGDARTFRHVKLGPLTDEALRMHADLVGLRLGPKGKLSAEQALRFTEISGLKDEDAHKAFEEFVKSAPDFAPGYICLGRASMALDDYDEAARSFEQATRLEPGNADAHLNLGRALMKRVTSKQHARNYRLPTILHLTIPTCKELFNCCVTNGLRSHEWLAASLSGRLLRR